jgi:hypothetical protein
MARMASPRAVIDEIRPAVNEELQQIPRFDVRYLLVKSLRVKEWNGMRQ